MRNNKFWQLPTQKLCVPDFGFYCHLAAQECDRKAECENWNILKQSTSQSWSFHFIWGCLKCWPMVIVTVKVQWLWHRMQIHKNYTIIHTIMPKKTPADIKNWSTLYLGCHSFLWSHRIELKLYMEKGKGKWFGTAYLSTQQVGWKYKGAIRRTIQYAWKIKCIKTNW